MSIYEDKLTKGSATAEDNLAFIKLPQVEVSEYGTTTPNDQLAKDSATAEDNVTKSSGSGNDQLAKSAGTAEDLITAGSASGEDMLESVNAESGGLTFTAQPWESGLTFSRTQPLEGEDNFEHNVPDNPFDFAFTSDSYDFLTETETLDFIRN